MSTARVPFSRMSKMCSSGSKKDCLKCLARNAEPAFRPAELQGQVGVIHEFGNASILDIALLCSSLKHQMQFYFVCIYSK